MGAIKKAKPIDRGEDNHNEFFDDEEGVIWPNDEEQSSAIETQTASVTH
jgi:hypothetical protein